MPEAVLPLAIESLNTDLPVRLDIPPFITELIKPMNSSAPPGIFNSDILRNKWVQNCRIFKIKNLNRFTF